MGFVISAFTRLQRSNVKPIFSYIEQDRWPGSSRPSAFQPRSKFPSAAGSVAMILASDVLQSIERIHCSVGAALRRLAPLWPPGVPQMTPVYGPAGGHRGAKP